MQCSGQMWKHSCYIGISSSISRISWAPTGLLRPPFRSNEYSSLCFSHLTASIMSSTDPCEICANPSCSGCLVWRCHLFGGIIFYLNLFPRWRVVAGRWVPGDVVDCYAYIIFRCQSATQDILMSFVFLVKLNYTKSKIYSLFFVKDFCTHC